MSNVFNSVKGLHPKRNGFSAHTYRNDLTSHLGVNIPIYQQHVVAGTRIKVSTSALVRLQALIAPIMDNIDLYVHFWKIPYRLLENDKFTQFISGEIDPSSYDALFVTPFEFASELVSVANDTLTITDHTAVEWKNILFGNGSLLDYLGYDVGLFPDLEIVSTSLKIKSNTGNNNDDFNYRPLIAYYMLHLNWYMNENVPYFVDFVDDVNELVNEQSLNKLAALIVKSYKTFGTTLLPHGWDKDYFTSALPNVQYGDPVTLGLAGSAPVSLVSTNPAVLSLQGVGTGGYSGPTFVLSGNRSGSEEIAAKLINGSASDSNKLEMVTPTGAQTLDEIQGRMSIVDQKGGFAVADLSEASAITINEFRVANALQVFKERQMRYGRRRQEYYKGFFDVTPEDLRLQLPKYLGGGRIPINISDIEQTSQTTKGAGGSAQGNLAGKATAVAGGFAGFTTFCSEESIIIGIGFAMPHITYAQSVSKFLLKTNDPYDYFNPSFEHLGEQQIDNIEIYAGSSNPDGVFGYTPRFNEYRFHNNEMHGEFKDTLAYWTLGRIFSDQPALNADFVYMQPSVFDRIFAVSGQPSMLVSALFSVKLIQPVSKYGTPRLMV